MPITDHFDSFSPDLSGPVTGGFDIVADDTTDLAILPRALMVGMPGDLAVMFGDGTAVTLPSLSPGVIYPVRVARVLATGTTATGIRGLY